jgi:predicted nucleic acid-binding protein
MKIESALMGITKLFLDTAPVIYYVQGVAPFFPQVDRVFHQIESGSVMANTSPVTLGECLVYPLRLGDAALQQNFVDLLTNSEGISLIDIDMEVGQHAAEIRVRYGLKLPDAMQVASAIASGCDAFLTNDAQLKRITEVKIIVVSELEL